MTIEHSALKRLRIIRETGQSEFAVSKLASISSFFDLPAFDITHDPGRIHEDPGHVVQKIDDLPNYVRMPDQPKFGFSFNLGAPAPSSTASAGPIEELLEVLLGGKFETPADTVQGAGATTTVIPATSGAAWEPGSAMGVVISGVLYVREVASVSSNNVTLKHALPSAPGNGATIMGCHTFYPGAGNYDSSSSLALQAMLNSAVTDQMWLYRGAQAESFALNTELGTFPKCTVQMMAAAAARVTNALADATYDHRHHIITDSVFRVAAVGTSTNTQTWASSMEWQINLAYQAIKAAHATNLIAGYVRKPGRPFASGSFVVPVENDDYDDVVEAGESSTKRSITLQCGSIPSQGATMISVPQCHLTKALPEDIEEIAGQKIDWVAQRDDQTSGGSIENLNDAAFRIHVCRITAA